MTNLLATGIFSVVFAPFVRHVLRGSAEFYNALIQVRTDDAYRGRVSGAYGTMWSAILLISTVTATLITDSIGIRIVLIAGSLILVLAGLGAVRLLPRNVLADEP